MTAQSQPGRRTDATDRTSGSSDATQSARGPGSSVQPSIPRAIRWAALYAFARIALVAMTFGVFAGLNSIFGRQLPLALLLVAAVAAGVAISAVALRRLRRRVNSEITRVDDQRRERRDPCAPCAVRERPRSSRPRQQP
ncbi:DUF4229 domain-containing protein [Antrihabitans sp. NCIMB 15449]|uniref:DUF4229 domain-containing protein n=1 Tax=Antrihabitans spumae TaxID=3373370 RepID=A0ABW7JQ37_9NOCA